MKSAEFYEIINGLLPVARALAESNNSPTFTAYRDKVAQLVTFVNGKKDSKDEFKVEDLKQLVAYLGETRVALGDIKDNGAPEKMHSTAAEHLSMIEHTVALMDVTKKKPLTSAVDGTAMFNLELGAEASRVGASSSSRAQISVRGLDKKSVDGFFTPEEKLFDDDANKRIELVVRDVLKKYRKNEVLREIIEKAKEKDYGYYRLISCMEMGFDRPTEGDPLKTSFTRAFSYKRLDARGFIPYGMDIKKLNENKGVREFLVRARMAFTSKEVHKFGNQYAQYGPMLGFGIKAKGGSSVSGRNVAMSNVANILGIPNLVAKAIPMTVKEKDKDVSGVFMQKAVGLDLPRDYSITKTDFMTLEGGGYSGEALKQLADLQILDYLCQYVDRHQNNVLYTINNGKIQSIQAIDNDTSFGTLTPKENYNVQNGSCLHDITVISESMKATIENLQPETLVAAVSGLGLTEAEITAAKERLRILKEYIATHERTGDDPRVGTVKVIKDADWDKQSIYTLSAARVPNRVSHNGKKRGNIYTRALAVTAEAKRIRDEAYGNKDAEAIAKYKADKEKYKYSQNPTNGSYVFTNSLDELSTQELKKNRATFENMHAALLAGETEQVLANPAYATMKSALEAVLEFSHEKEMDYKECVKYNDALIELESATNAYIDDCVDKGIAKNGIKEQMDKARALREFVDRHERIFQQASQAKQEAELNAIHEEIQLEQKQFDQIVDKLAEKLVGKLPGIDKASLAEMIMEGPVLRALLDKQKVEDNGEMRNNYKYYAELAKSDAKTLVADYIEEALKIDRSEYVDDLHFAILDEDARKKGVAPDVMLLKDNRQFKDMIFNQGEKYKYATGKVIKQVNGGGKANPNDLALVFAERVVMNHLKSLEDRPFSSELYDEVTNQAYHTDYEKEIEKIVVDPAFIKVSQELKAGACDVDSLNNLFVKYISEKNPELQVNNGQPVVHQEDLNVNNELNRNEEIHNPSLGARVKA